MAATLRSCRDCLAWGVLDASRCKACTGFRHNYPREGRCMVCRRKLNLQEQRCRLCWVQARAEARAEQRFVRTHDAQVTTEALFAPPAARRGHQLFFAGSSRHHAGATVHKATKRVVKRPTPQPASRPSRVGAQLPLLTGLVRDFTAVERGFQPDADNPWLRWGRYRALILAETRGWSTWTATMVDLGLRIVLSTHAEGDTVSWCQMDRALRPRKIPTSRVADVLTDMDLLLDDRPSALERRLTRKLDGIAPGIRSEVETWIRERIDGGPRTRARHGRTVEVQLIHLRPMLLAWSNSRAHLREITRDDVLTVLADLRGYQRQNTLGALRSLLGSCKRRGTIFRNPTAGITLGAVPKHIVQPLTASELNQATAAATAAATTKPVTGPAARVVLVLAAVHAARPRQIRALQLDDVDVPGQRLVIGEHDRPLDALTARVLTEWLIHRRARWPRTANPHLLINQKTAHHLDQVAEHWIGHTFENLPATPDRLRIDRQLDEALTRDADPLNLTAVFGISQTTALRWAANARSLTSSLEPDRLGLPAARIPESAAQRDGDDPATSP